MKNRSNFISAEFETLVKNLGSPKLRNAAKQQLLTKYRYRLGAILYSLDDVSPQQLLAISSLVEKYPDAFLEDLETLLRQRDYVLDDKIWQIFEAVGAGAIDLGLKLLDADDPSISKVGNEILRAVDEDGLDRLRRLLTTDDPSKNGIAVLADIDPDSYFYFRDQLADALGTTDQLTARYAVDAIGSIGDYGIPLLLDLLASPDPFKQQNATNALIALGEIAVPDLVEELDSPVASVQQNSMRALREIGSAAIPSLKRALESESQLMVQNANAILQGDKMKPRGDGILKRFRRAK